MKNFRRLYRTMSMDEILGEKIGTCIEQAWLMKMLLDRIKVPNEMFCCRVFESEDFSDMDEEEHMHCFVLFFKNSGKESPTTRFSEVPDRYTFKEFNCYINNIMEREQAENGAAI